MALQIKQTRRNSAQKEAALTEAGREEMTRLNIEVPLSLHQKLKLHTAQAGKGITIKTTVIAAVEAYLEGKE